MFGPRRVLAKNFIEGCHEQIRIRFRQYQRRTQFDDVVMWPVRSRQDSAFAQAVHDVICFFWRGFTRRAVPHEVHAKE